MAYAYNKGATIVAASGNDDANVVCYPAAYDAYVIAVGATRYDEAIAWYSNTGTSLDLTAPGGDTGVDQNGDGYADGVLQQTFDKNPGDFGYWFYQGTSMATPHVAGVAALVIANEVQPIGPDQVREALEKTAEDKGANGWDAAYGWGIVDAHAALQYVGQPVHDVAVTDVTAPSPCMQGDLVSVDVSVANPGDYQETFDVTLTDTTDVVEIGSQSVTLVAKASTTVSFAWDTVSASIGDHILKGEASVVAGETNTANNSQTTTVTVQVPVHDVAITAIDAPSEAVVGESVSVSVTVENQGTYQETTTVTLTDTTDAVQIGSQPVTLAAGDSTTVPFDWDTTGSSLGEHILEAVASVVPGETETADNSMTTTVTITEGATMHVASIDMSLKTAGPNTNASAKVTIVDADGVLVAGATVTGDWTLNGSYLNTASATTKKKGTAGLNSDRVKAASGDIFTITITNVVKDGYIYDPASNVETSDSIIRP